MRISLTIPNNHRVAALLQPWQDEVGGARIGEVAALADRLGFSRLTVGEHLLVPKNHVALSGAHYVDAPTALAYLAGHTSRIRLISNVSIVALKHPVVSAKQWAVLDWLSDGRADLMIGAGWLKEEFEVLGVDFHTRGRRLDECVEAMRRIWTSELSGASAGHPTCSRRRRSPKVSSGSARTRTTGARRSASSSTSPACAWPRSTG